jgi:probable HAF family extracellular repeat protein
MRNLRLLASLVKLAVCSVSPGLMLLFATSVEASDPAFVLTNGSFLEFAVPGSPITTAWDINNVGQIVGDYREPPDAGSPLDYGPSQAFVLSNNTITTLRPFDSLSSQALGINDFGSIVGVAYGPAGDHRSFLYADGIYAEVNVPTATSTAVFGINNNGLMSGFFSDALGYHGFIGDGEHFTAIDVPGSLGTLAYGLNDLGQVVGRYADSAGGQSGFVYSDGNYYSFGIAGSNFMNPFAINNLGSIVGYYGAENGPQSFLLSDFSFSAIDAPPHTAGNTVVTIAYGVNDFNQVVGTIHEYTPDTPVPEPQTLLLFLIGLLGLAMQRTIARPARSDPLAA